MGLIREMQFYMDPAITPAVYQKTMERIEAIAATMTADLNGLGEVEKALLLHDRLAVHCEYAYAEYLAGTTKETPSFYRMVGALNDGKAVCMGYTIADSVIIVRGLAA